MSPEAAMAVAYVAFLTAAALGLDLAARHSHRRSERYRTGGFAFRHELDAWECPEGEFLRRVELDHSARLVRYRARAAVCNACPAKRACTDSDEGREIVAALDPWPHSEAGHFHRGISIAMLCLAALVSAVALLRNTAPIEFALLASALLLVVALLGRMLATLRATPANPPASLDSSGRTLTLTRRPPSRERSESRAAR
jgi:hypothetical protein